MRTPGDRGRVGEAGASARRIAAVSSHAGWRGSTGSASPPHDNGTTSSTAIVDQSALHGLLQKVRDIGLPLVTVTQVARPGLIRPPHHLDDPPDIHEGHTDMTHTQSDTKTVTPAASHSMNRFIRRIGEASARRPWRTIGAWAVLAALVVALAGALGGAFVDDFSAPGSESAQAMKLLDERFPEAAGGSAVAVFAAPDGKQLTDFRPGVESALSRSPRLEHVATVSDPFADRPGLGRRAGRVRRDHAGRAVDRVRSPDRGGRRRRPRAGTGRRA